MKYSKKLALTLATPACQAFFLCLTEGASVHGEANPRQIHGNGVADNLHKQLNAKKIMDRDIAIHGILLWSSMGFLMPLGILMIRISIGMKNRTWVKALFYLHVILQVLSLLLATAGAILSIKSFENTFNNHHQRLGLILYVAIWVQALIGLLRPSRGTRRRCTWYLAHWMLGTTVSLLGIINIYTGLNAYHQRASKATWLWNILFTAEVALLAFSYLLIDKWDYVQKQGVVSGSDGEPSIPTTTTSQLLATDVVDSQKELVLLPPVPCSKRNALKNLFD